MGSGKIVYVQCKHHNICRFAHCCSHGHIHVPVEFFHGRQTCLTAPAPDCGEHKDIKITDRLTGICEKVQE